MSYYQFINGVKMDGEIIELANKAMGQQGDGRISMYDAEKIFDAVQDEKRYTDVERDTVAYIMKEYRWTDAAYDWFMKRLSGLTEPEGIQRMPVDELSEHHFPKRDVLYTPEAQAARLHDLRTAMVETNDDHEELGLIVRLVTGERVEIMSNFIEVSGDHVQVRGGHMIPIHAIERVEI
ncbi:MAG: hypothetical protein MUE95_10915 [Cyclobacteriaceae bacterium]|jgi:hypothetical protein|nr:hypothetical protein [Cyclobacteriaceae bacterium]